MYSVATIHLNKHQVLVFFFLFLALNNIVVETPAIEILDDNHNYRALEQKKKQKLSKERNAKINFPIHKTNGWFDMSIL